MNHASCETISGRGDEWSKKSIVYMIGLTLDNEALSNDTRMNTHSDTTTLRNPSTRDSDCENEWKIYM